MQTSVPVVLAISRSDDPPFWIKAVFAFALVGAALWMHASNSKKASKTPPPIPDATGTAAPLGSDDRGSDSNQRDKTIIQKAFAIPGIGGWLSALVGFIIPFILLTTLLHPIVGDNPFGLTYIFGALALWNLLFTAIARVRINLLFIPSWIVCLIGLVYSIYDALSSHTP